jgi:hypothetical protein
MSGATGRTTRQKRALIYLRNPTPVANHRERRRRRDRTYRGSPGSATPR